MSEGLLIVTNDGELSRALEMPNQRVERVSPPKIDGIIRYLSYVISNIE